MAMNYNQSQGYTISQQPQQPVPIFPNQVMTSDGSNYTQQPLIYPQQPGMIQQINQPVQPVIQTVQPVVQQVAIPTQVVQYVFVTDPMQELATSTSAIIQQEADFLETFSGCDRPNKYHIFIHTPLGLRYMFKCTEQGDCCSRNCCSTDMRNFELYFNHITSTNEYYGKSTSKTFLKLKKPCSVCFKPKIVVEHFSLGTRYGKIKQASCTMDPEVDIYDNNNYLLYEISTECCQAGMCLGAACSKLSEVNFRIKQNGRTVGNLTKCTSTAEEFFTKADTYEVDFPRNASVNEKLLIIVSSLLIDYLYFEESGIDEERDRRVYYHGPHHHGHHHGHGHW